MSLRVMCLIGVHAGFSPTITAFYPACQGSAHYISLVLDCTMSTSFSKLRTRPAHPQVQEKSYSCNLKKIGRIKRYDRCRLTADVAAPVQLELLLLLGLFCDLKCAAVLATPARRIVPQILSEVI